MRRAPLLLALVLGACAPVDPGTPVAAADLCATIAETICAADRGCCEASPRDCTTVQRSACASALGAMLEDPRLAYDELGGGALAAAIERSAASCWEEPFDHAALEGAFAGTGGLGADCTPLDRTTASLRASSLSCARGLACRLYLRADGSTEGECAPRADDGCSHPLDCGEGTFCSLAAGWEPGVWGTCRPLRADGWACASDLECASRHCDGTCAPAPASARCLVTGYGDLVLESAPLAYLRFDERSGTRIEDLSGNGHSATLGGAERDEHGAISVAGATPTATDDGGAIRFTSDEALVRVASMDELEGAAEMTLEAWIRPDDLEGIHPILELSDGTDPGPHLWQFDRGDKLYASFPRETGEAATVMSGEGALTAGAWHHAVATWDGAAVRLYLDGRRVGEMAATGPLRSGGDLYVGHRATGEAPTSFRGSIDEVAIYDRALAPAEIARHHEAGTEGVLTADFALFRWLR